MGICVVSHRFHPGTSPQTSIGMALATLTSLLASVEDRFWNCPDGRAPHVCEVASTQISVQDGHLSDAMGLQPYQRRCCPENALRYCMRPYHSACHPSVTGFWPFSEQPIGTESPRYADHCNTPCRLLLMLRWHGNEGGRPLAGGPSFVHCAVFCWVFGTASIGATLEQTTCLV